ncbi:MAG: D-alanyl-D-alanine carboxypeptidase/D-alanyl-D-alanine-endopeptidase [Paludibacter sp.]|nr:D-alanyl-D-alanine carboxypeptidase/D-alanyl-D-alanine-endopeptidase [Paludibacter sp.]
MKKFILLFSIIVISVSIFASNPVSNFTNNPVLQNANISLLVTYLKTGKTLYEIRPKNATVTASTIKVITTSTALEVYGPDFRFVTRLEIDGEIGKDSTLNGNLYVRGGGDPTLGSDKMGDKDFLSKWVSAVKKRGIKNINGKIIADPVIFEQQVINPKWSWEDMGNYYAPAIHGISYLDNTFKLYFRSAKAGTITEMLRTEPEISGLKIDNFVKSANINFDNAYFYGAPFSYNRSVTGEIPANKTEFVVRGDIPEPALLLAQHFRKKLIESGVYIGDAAVVQTNEACKKFVIYSHFSPPLSEIITEINVKSNNHYAEYLFKYLGTKNNKTGTTDAAIEHIRSFWKSKGLSVDQLFQSDGSGLSTTNAASANFFVELLTYMQLKSKYADIFYKSLPVSGESGTIKDLLKNTALQGKLRAKSGTIARVKCYVGYVETKSTTLVLAILVNNANGSSSAVTQKIEEFLLDITK